MRFTAFLATLLLTTSAVCSCSEDEKNEPAVQRPGSPVAGPVSGTTAEKGPSEHHNGVGYSFQLLGAGEFLQRKGETPAESDRETLSEESVLIVDFSASRTKEVFSDERITMDRDAAMQYLVGEITGDVSIEQNGKTYAPEGAHYEKGLSELGKLRVFLYFRSVNPQQPAKVVYYDRLFGAGFMRVTV